MPSLTGRKHFFRSTTITAVKWACIFGLWTSPLLPVHGQNLDLIRTVNVHDSITSVSADTEGNIYVATSRGLLSKYNNEGDSLLTFSPKKIGIITLVEAWWGLRIFLFYEDFQQYLLLDQFFRPTEYFSFNPYEVGFVELATIANDNNIWLLDQSDFSLKKYEANTNSLIFSTPVDLILERKKYEIGFMREYNNMLVLVDPTQGVFLFDNMGNYKTRLNIVDINYLGFLEDEMYFLRNGYLTFLNLFSGKSRAIPLPSIEYGRFYFPIVTKNRVFLFTGSTFTIYILRD